MPSEMAAGPAARDSAGDSGRPRCPHGFNYIAHCPECSPLSFFKGVYVGPVGERDGPIFDDDDNDDEWWYDEYGDYDGPRCAIHHLADECASKPWPTGHCDEPIDRQRERGWGRYRDSSGASGLGADARLRGTDLDGTGFGLQRWARDAQRCMGRIWRLAVRAERRTGYRGPADNDR